MSREQPIEDVAGDGALALAPARPRAGAHGEAHRGAQGGGGERTVEPSPAVTGAQLARRRLTVEGACGPSGGAGRRAAGRGRGRDLGWHAVGEINLALGGYPQVMGDEFQRQALRCRPDEGRAGSRLRPGFEIGEIGSERAQAEFSPIPSRARCLSVATSSSLRICASRSRRSIGQDGGERVELQRPARFGIGGAASGGFRSWTRPRQFGSAGLAATGIPVDRRLVKRRERRASRQRKSPISAPLSITIDKGYSRIVMSAARPAIAL